MDLAPCLALMTALAVDFTDLSSGNRCITRISGQFYLPVYMPLAETSALSARREHQSKPPLHPPNRDAFIQVRGHAAAYSARGLVGEYAVAVQRKLRGTSGKS